MTGELENRITMGTDAHANDPDERPEDHIGEEIPDPWKDLEQADWTTDTLDLSES